jgi:hypothetical protein
MCWNEKAQRAYDGRQSREEFVNFREVSMSTPCYP